MASTYNNIIDSIREKLEEAKVDYDEEINKEDFGNLHIFKTTFGTGFCLQPKKAVYYYVLDNGRVKGMEKEGFDKEFIEDADVWIQTSFYKFCDYLTGKRVDFLKSRRVTLLK